MKMATSILRISLLVTLVMVAFTGLLLVPVACVAPWWADILSVGVAIAALVLALRLYGRWSTVTPCSVSTTGSFQKTPSYDDAVRR